MEKLSFHIDTLKYFYILIIYQDFISKSQYNLVVFHLKTFYKRMDNHGKKIPHCQTKQMNSGIYGDSIGSDWIPLSKVVSR